MPNSMILANKVLLLLWIFQSTPSTLSASVHSPHSKIVNQHLKSYENHHKIEFGNKNRKYLETLTPPDVMEAINTKINELKSYFQDSINLLDDQPEKEQEEPNTTIEFVPNVLTPKVLKSRNNDNEIIDKHLIRKYQKLRDEIKMRLEKETVSSSTQKLIIKTIDQLIEILVSAHCDWKPNKVLQLAGKKGLCKINNITLTEEECKKLVLQYFVGTRTKNDSRNSQPKINLANDFNRTANELVTFFQALWQNESLTFLQKFTNTIADIMSETQTLSDKYKVKCSLVKTDSEATRRTNCDNFRLCTDEFRVYLSEFYKHLNDTAVSAFRNYAAMYVRDVNSGAIDEKESVTKTITALSDIVEKRVQNGFIKYTRKISLSDDKKHNIKIIKEYIKATTRYLRKHIKKHLEEDLINLNDTLSPTIKQDININLDVDLGNIESNFLGRMCTFFVTCNGEVGLPPRKGFNSKNTNLDPRSVFVKVELTLDDDLKGSIKSNDFRRNNVKQDYNNIDSTKKIIVTRTTLH